MTKTGVQEWAGTSINIQRGCEHNCRYCYARFDCVTRHKRCRAEHWPLPCIDEAKVNLSYKKKYPGRVMFPTTHDITPANIEQYCEVLRKLLEAGNEVLIVTKPHRNCVIRICDEQYFRDLRDRIMFRFTIGSVFSDVLKFWEPGAPLFVERFDCLVYAKEQGFQTSISCEPYLDMFPQYVYEVCKDLITDTFWIGKLRNWESRVVLKGVVSEEMSRFVAPLKICQNDWYVKQLYATLNGKPGIQWKDSITQVITKSERK